MGPVDESFCQVQLSTTTQVLGESSKDFFQRAVPHPALEAAVTRLIRRIAAGQVLPRRTGPENPKHAVENVSRVAIRPTTKTLMDRLLFGKKRLDRSPLLLGQVHIEVRSNFDPPVDPLLKSDRVSRT